MTSRKIEDNTAAPYLARREMMKAAAATAGLALFPATAAFARTLVPVQPKTITVAVGYLQTANRSVRGSASTASFVNATSIAATPATYQLRVLSASANQPLSLDAQYANGAEHHFWQAWTESGMLQHSPPSTIRWWANDKKALPLLVWCGGNSTLAYINAQPGTYAMMVSPAAQAVPAWSTVQLQGGAANGASAKLISRGAPVALPYFVFEVQPIDV